MNKQFENTTPPQETYEDLLEQERQCMEEHTRLLRALENDPKDPELRVAVDKAYDKYRESRRNTDLLLERKQADRKE